MLIKLSFNPPFLSAPKISYLILAQPDWVVLFLRPEVLHTPGQHLLSKNKERGVYYEK